MDEPLLSYEADALSYELPPGVNINRYCQNKRLTHALQRDNKDEFVQLINSLSSVELEDGHLYEPQNLRRKIFMWDSANCFAAVLAGETKIPNVADFPGPTPMHQAASRSFRIMSLLLQMGFSADARSNYSSDLRDVLPLGVALSAIRFAWLENVNLRRSSASAVNFIINPQTFYTMRDVEVVRLLSHNTREVKHEFYNYLKEGKMVEVCVLLLAAKSQLLSSSTANGEFRSISEMHEFLLDEIVSFKKNNSLTELHCKNKLIEMEETLVLLKIFGKIGDKLATFIRICDRQSRFYYFPNLAAASLIEDAGFDVNTEDLYASNFCSRTARNRYEFFQTGVPHCQETAFTTYAFPSWLKEATLGCLAFKSGSTSRFTNPLSKALPEINHVSASATAMPECMPLQHLLKRSTPFLGAVQRVIRHA